MTSAAVWQPGGAVIRCHAPGHAWPFPGCPSEPPDFPGGGSEDVGWQLWFIVGIAPDAQRARGPDRLQATCTPQSSFEDPFPSGNAISHHQPGNIRGDRCNYWFDPDYCCRTSMEVRGGLETVIAFNELWIKLPIHACRDLCHSRVLPIINPRA